MKQESTRDDSRIKCMTDIHLHVDDCSSLVHIPLGKKILGSLYKVEYEMSTLPHSFPNCQPKVTAAPAPVMVMMPMVATWPTAATVTLPMVATTLKTASVMIPMVTIVVMMIMMISDEN